MLSWITEPALRRRKARNLYGAVVAQARNPAFYKAFGVADTPEGRYELIALHLVLLLERLGQIGLGAERLRQDIADTFVTDLDDAMREMGVGDPSVPRKVKRAAGGVHLRAEAYRAALSTAGIEERDGSAVAAALGTYVYQGQPDDRYVARLGAYVQTCAAHLAALPAGGLLAGDVSFPPPGGPDDAT